MFHGDHGTLCSFRAFTTEGEREKERTEERKKRVKKRVEKMEEMEGVCTLLGRWRKYTREHRFRITVTRGWNN